MSTKTFQYTSLAISLIEKLMGSRFVVRGIENIPNNPVMFVANHFTRSETFFVPYLIHKYTGRQVRSLADSELFTGFLGRFLENVGSLSTKNINRDGIIIKDLVCGDYDWLIYPEGSMIKNKKIEKKDFFISHTPNRIGHVRTGSAVLALKSQLYRQDLIEAFNNNNENILNDFENTYKIKYNNNFKNLTTYIVPLSITYFPIRPGHNKIEAFAQKKIKTLSPRISEELQIEGNLLSNSEIILNFSKPINLKDYSSATRDIIYQIPIIKNETKTNFVTRYFKYKLTTDFMSQIYSNIEINIDHIFSAALRHIPSKDVKINHLKRIIYMSAILISKSGKYGVNNSINENELFKIFLPYANKNFDEIFNLAVSSREISIINEKYIRINRSNLFKEDDFHKTRITNTLQVIYNEFSLLDIANNIVKRVSKIDEIELKEKTREELCKFDSALYEDDYNKFYDKKFSKDKNIGSPYFLNVKSKLSKKHKNTGILISHGYKSSPKEVENLAKYLNNLGYKVYAVRLRGHGTAPINMKDISYNDWLESIQRGYAILENCCKHIVMIGFSTGGLLTLFESSKAEKINKISAVISINSAIKLVDIRARFVPTINLWNEMLEMFHIQKAKFEYVDDTPECPEFNYSRNYLKAVEELEKLMNVAEESLKNIKCPILVIQSKNDPIVNPESGKIIFNKIQSKNKEIFEPMMNNHVIINGEGKDIIFYEINKFLARLTF